MNILDFQINVRRIIIHRATVLHVSQSVEAEQCPNVSTTPITVMGCQQCLSLRVVQLKGKNCRKPHCRKGFVDRFRQCGLWTGRSKLKNVIKMANWQYVEKGLGWLWAIFEDNFFLISGSKLQFFLKMLQCLHWKDA